MLTGKQSNVASSTYTPASSVTVRIKCSGTSYTVWVDGTQELSATDATFAAGTIGLIGQGAIFENVKAGCDA